MTLEQKWMLAGQTPSPSAPSPQRLNSESGLRWKYEMDTHPRLQLEAQEVEAHAELRRAELRRVPPAQPRPTRAAARGGELACTHRGNVRTV